MKVKVYLSIYLSTYLSIYLSIDRSIDRSIAGLAFVSVSPEGRLLATASVELCSLTDVHKEFLLSQNMARTNQCELKRHMNILPGSQITKFEDLNRSPEFLW